MLRRLVVATLVLSLIGSVITIPAYAQSLYWNVPAPYVVEKGHASMTISTYLRPWHTVSGADEFAYVQGVYGVGTIGLLPGPAEIGLNIGSIDLHNLHRSAPFMDAAVKIHLLQTDAFGISAGNNVGVGLSGATAGRVRDYVYSMVATHLPLTGAMISAGPYYATRDVFDSHSRFGGQFTFEQPLPFLPGFSFVVDHRTGHNGALTPGLMWNKDPMTVGVGYNISNNGRKDNLVQILASATF